VHKSSQLGY